MNGLGAIAFALMAFARPGLTLWAVVMLFGVYALSDGLTALWRRSSGEMNRDGPGGRLLLVGIDSILVGIIAIARPDTTVVALLTLIAVWAIIQGGY